MLFGQHIELRWWQRGGRDRPNIEQAWGESISVSIPGRGDIDARLHTETNTVIAHKGGGGGTILNSDFMVLIKDGERVCGNCLCQLQDDNRCPNPECPN